MFDRVDQIPSGRRPGGILAWIILMLTISASVTACSVSSSPAPASSSTFASGGPWSETSASVQEGRVAIAYVADNATQSEVRQLSQRIAGLPQIRSYAFMTKDDALEFMRGRFDGASSDDASPVPSLPMGFWLLLRDPADLPDVTRALRKNPAIRHDESPFSGIGTASGFYAAMAQ